MDSVDVYTYFCSKLECPCEGNKFSLLCSSSNGSRRASMTESKVTSAYLAKYVPSQTKLLISVKYSIFNVWMANRLIGRI
jgi:hypothetical protein